MLTRRGTLNTHRLNRGFAHRPSAFDGDGTLGPLVSILLVGPQDVWEEVQQDGILEMPLNPPELVLSAVSLVPGQQDTDVLVLQDALYTCCNREERRLVMVPGDQVHVPEEG